MVEALAGGTKQPQELCAALGVKSTGALSEVLATLVTSGFVARDYAWDMTGRKTRLSTYRILDNYLRFYLKYVEPLKERITAGLFAEASLEDVVNRDVLAGLQFENLVLNNRVSILKRLNLRPNTVLSASPYFQRRTARKHACQIDLLVHTKGALYPCEIRFRRKIDSSVIDDVKSKLVALTRPPAASIRPVLIYEGELARSVTDQDFFDHIIRFADLLMPGHAIP